MSSLFTHLTDFVGCSYIAHLYFVAESNLAMTMSLPISTRALIRYFRYLTSMHVLTCLLRTGRTSLGLCAVYEGDCIQFLFASDVGEGQFLAKYPIPLQHRQVNQYGGASIRDETGVSVADLATYGFGSWILNSAISFRISSTFFLIPHLWYAHLSVFVVLRVVVCQPSHTTSVFGFLIPELFSSYSLIPSATSRSSVPSLMLSSYWTSLLLSFSSVFCTVFGLSSFSLSLCLIYTSSCRAIRSDESKSYGCLSRTFNAKSGFARASRK